MEAPPDIIPERRSDPYTGEKRQSGLERCKAYEMPKILQQQRELTNHYSYLLSAA